jgi:lipoate-protein ligase A
MHFLSLTLPTLPENLALDEALLLQAEEAAGGEVLRIWEWPAPAVVLGAGSRLVDDVDEAGCQGDGVPICRRSSGGGTVLLGAGCLCYSLVLAYDRDPALTQVRSSYVYILERLRAALSDLIPGVACAGISDLARAGRKFSGNAQQRKRTHLLHHGTLLYAFDLSRMGRYLKSPPRQPEYRANRGHDEFLGNIPSLPEALRQRLSSTWSAVADYPRWPQDLVARLVAVKYARREWTCRR